MNWLCFQIVCFDFFSLSFVLFVYLFICMFVFCFDLLCLLYSLFGTGVSTQIFYFCIIFIITFKVLSLDQVHSRDEPPPRNMGWDCLKRKEYNICNENFLICVQMKIQLWCLIISTISIIKLKRKCKTRQIVYQTSVPGNSTKNTNRSSVLDALKFRIKNVAYKPHYGVWIGQYHHSNLDIFNRFVQY